MKKLLLLFVASLLCFQSFGQGSYEISLAKESLELDGRKFYIASVVDARKDKSNIGNIRQGLMDSNHPVVLKDGLTNALQTYFDGLLPKEATQIPISVKVNGLKVAQSRSNSSERAYVELYIEFYYDNKQLFSDEESLEVFDDEALQLHEGNIREVLKRSVGKLNNCEWFAKMDGATLQKMTSGAVLGDDAPRDASAGIRLKPDVVEYETKDGQSRNITTLGYQIGGYSLIGLDYEIRFNDFLGVHAGGGFRGYTYGLMMHTGPKKNSPYFNFSFKDGGFGLLEVIGVEYGGRLVLNKQSGFALTFQIGLAKILKIDHAMETALFQGGAPGVMSSMGIGFSW